MVEGDGDLDEGLQEELFGLRGGEPDGFPGFVGGEVSAGVVLAEAFGERAVGPVEGHVFGRKERTTEILVAKAAQNDDAIFNWRFQRSFQHDI